MSEYNPEINVLPFGPKYRPMYRLQPHERWCMIRRNKVPVECDTAFQAQQIAQDLIDSIVSPAHVIEYEPQPLGSLEEWRRNREAAAEAEKLAVFGSQNPTRLFRKGREIKVETKKRRAFA
jgi:hypothetical protein